MIKIRKETKKRKKKLNLCNKYLFNTKKKKKNFVDNIFFKLIISIDGKLESEIKMRIMKEFDMDKKEDIDKHYAQVKETLHPDNRDLLTVFALDSNEQAFDIDIAILTSLLKGKPINYDFI